MITQRDLKNKLKSVNITQKLSDAVKSISAAKYYRINSAYNDFLPYAQALNDLSRTITDPYAGRTSSGKKCFVVISSNRGLCGGYNTNLFNFFKTLIEGKNNPLVIACGRRGIDVLSSNNIKIKKSFVFSDIPSYSESKAFGEYLINLYASGEAGEIIMVYQKFKNILVQTPEFKTLLPLNFETGEEDEYTFYPGKEEVEKALFEKVIKNQVHFFLMEWARGVNAATMTAMRTSSDNAKKLKADLELTLNRKRQSSVTSGVTETSHSENSNTPNAEGGK